MNKELVEKIDNYINERTPGRSQIIAHNLKKDDEDAQVGLAARLSNIEKEIESLKKMLMNLK